MRNVAFGFCFPCTRQLSSSKLRMCSRKPPSPILVADVLDTLVVDPFFNGMSAYFGFPSFSDFVNAKTPDLWVQFELGIVDEEFVARNFFKDKTPIDLVSFKTFLKSTYRLVPGVDNLLHSLRHSGVDVHLCSNYPLWADLIEDSLHLTPRFNVKWTFVSGMEGVRKPDKIAYERVAQKAGVDVSSCILLDDREKNCSGALAAGFKDAIHFQSTSQACEQLQKVFGESGVVLDFPTAPL